MREGLVEAQAAAGRSFSLVIHAALVGNLVATATKFCGRVDRKLGHDW
jgi:hypothetical protein